MKIFPALVLGLLLAATPLAAQTPRLEFDGVLLANGVTQVALLDLNTGNAAWIGIGGSFAGYTVTAFHPGTIDPIAGFSTADTLDLVGIGTNRRITLQLNGGGVETTPAAETPAEPEAWGPDPFLDD